jgi:phosphoribosylformylglycinamidine (FGAM) synthase-like enzyme
MKERKLTIPDIMMIGGTRVVLGIGIGLLLAERLTDDQRKAVGRSLLLVGAATTIPLAINVLGKSE